MQDLSCIVMATPSATPKEVGNGMEAMKRYDEARGWLAVLIDNPDKAVSVAAYKAQISAAQKAVKAAHKAWMVAWA